MYIPHTIDDSKITLRYEVFPDSAWMYNPSIPMRETLPGIKRVIFHAPATIIYWVDGSKTIVKCHDELFDREKGLAMAISKKALGNKGNYFEYFKHYIDVEE